MDSSTSVNIQALIVMAIPCRIGGSCSCRLILRHCKVGSIATGWREVTILGSVSGIKIYFVPEPRRTGTQDPCSNFDTQIVRAALIYICLKGVFKAGEVLESVEKLVRILSPCVWCKIRPWPTLKRGKQWICVRN